MKKIKKVAEYLLENGLIFEINRQVLHPLGLTLEIDINDEGKIDFGMLWDSQEDNEGFIFSPDAFLTGKEKFNKFLKDTGSKRLELREKKLGFVVQDKDH